MPGVLRFAFAAFLALGLGCAPDRPTGPLVVHEEQPFAGLVSRVQTGDPKLAAQLLKGWHTIEEGSWRWTERQFSLALKIPASGKPATLEMKFAAPEPLLAKLGSVTVTARVNGAALPAQSYDKPGEQFYRRSVSGATLSGDVARVDFELDRALPPTETDRRELGLVVISVGFQ